MFLISGANKAKWYGVVTIFLKMQPNTGVVPWQAPPVFYILAQGASVTGLRALPMANIWHDKSVNRRIGVPLNNMVCCALAAWKASFFIFKKWILQIESLVNTGSGSLCAKDLVFSIREYLLWKQLVKDCSGSSSQIFGFNRFWEALYFFDDSCFQGHLAGIVLGVSKLCVPIGLHHGFI